VWQTADWIVEAKPKPLQHGGKEETEKVTFEKPSAPSVPLRFKDFDF
jgi:hypothetical protein